MLKESKPSTKTDSLISPSGGKSMHFCNFPFTVIGIAKKLYKTKQTTIAHFLTESAEISTVSGTQKSEKVKSESLSS